MWIPAAISERRLLTRSAAVLAAAFALATSSPARAENPITVPDPAAQALFQDGRELIDKGRWDEGCAKFEASMILYPAASTLLNIARCHEHNKKLATAWSAYKRVQVLNRETVGEERRQAIEQTVAAEIQALTPRIPRIKLKLPEPIPGVLLRIDGEEMPVAAVGTELPVDVGEREITAEAPDRRPFRRRVDSKEGTLTEVSIEMLRPSDPDPTERKVPPWAWALGGSSLLLFGLSAGFRVDQAFVEGRQSGLCNGDVRTGCPPVTEYDPAADNRRKNIDFGLSIGFGVAGALALGASVYGILRGTAPAPAAPAAAVLITPGGAAAVATFHF